MEKDKVQWSKEIPQEVKNNGYGVYFCPKCHKSVWQNADESNYCFRCGQRIQWPPRGK